MLWTWIIHLPFYSTKSHEHSVQKGFQFILWLCGIEYKPNQMKHRKMSFPLSRPTLPCPPSILLSEGRFMLERALSLLVNLWAIPETLTKRAEEMQLVLCRGRVGEPSVRNIFRGITDPALSLCLLWPAWDHTPFSGHVPNTISLRGSLMKWCPCLGVLIPWIETWGTLISP